MRCLPALQSRSSMRLKTFKCPLCGKSMLGWPRPVEGGWRSYCLACRKDIAVLTNFDLLKPATPAYPYVLGFEDLEGSHDAG
jgi:hypothetical protein